MTTAARIGVSVVLPVFNGERYLDQVLAAVLGQETHPSRKLEVLAVDDRSTDGSMNILRPYLASGRVTLVQAEGRGAAAAINLGIRTARHPVICQLDQDMVPRPDWLERLLASLEADARLAAVQAHFLVDARDGLWARVSALDLRLRYARLTRGSTSCTLADHVCTGNTAYRATALHEVGLFDESLGYGYDNDISYRLGRAGYRLAHCPAALSIHRRARGLRAYWREQYGVGYGRLDVVAKHPSRSRGDQVSGLSMILHAAGMCTAMGLALLAVVLAVLGLGWRLPAGACSIVVILLALERLVAGLRATSRFRDAAGLCLVPAHLLRDVAWAWAVMCWALRRLRGVRGRPDHSMQRAHR